MFKFLLILLHRYLYYIIILLLLKVASKTRAQVERELGARLGNSVARSCTSTKSLLSELKDASKSKVDIPVEKIARNNFVNFSEKELASTRKATEALLASTSATTSTLSCLAAGVVKLLRAGAKEFEDKTSGHCYNILKLTKISSSDVVRSAPIVSLLQDIVEQGTLVEVFGSKVRELETQIISKDVAIDQLKSLVANGNVNQNVPEIALRVAAIMASTDKETSVLPVLLRNLVDNQDRKTGCRWSETTESLFAIILDYGGPALAKIITEKLGGPSLVTMYCSARCNYAIPQKLEAQIFSWAASFYKEIGYTGVFSLAVDATAITLLLKVKGNCLIGLAYETEVLLKTAEDIMW